jgi:ferredoxin
MAYKILNDLCICCGTCEAECRNAAISANDDGYAIDPKKCTECEGWFEFQKCAQVCPVGAPVPDTDYPK